MSSSSTGPAGTPAAAAPARVVVDLDAVRANVVTLRGRAGRAAVMAVVKADGYGHGMVPVARAARQAGAAWLGVAFPGEALALRAAGDDGPLLAWIVTPDDPLDDAVAADVTLSVGASWGVAAVSDAAVRAGRRASLQLELDTGLGRGGAVEREWPELLAAAALAERAGQVEVTGVWSHLARADEPGDPSIDAQAGAYRRALELVRRHGLRPRWRHLANSAATLTRPDLAYDLVRCGIAAYGVSPSPALGAAAALGLRPALRWEAGLALVKPVPAGEGVSYGHRYVTERETVLGVVPVGYADGVPRHATNVGPVSVGGRRHTVAGTVCMDQFVVDLGPGTTARPGDPVVLVGDPAAGEPTADDWAAACGTIGYEIVTRIGPRVPRVLVGDESQRPSQAGGVPR